MLGTMMTNEKVPLYYKEFDYLLCDLNYDAEEFLVHGKMGIIRDDDEDVCKARHACGGDRTMIFADVLWRTLSGRPLLSSRRYFRRIAWHQVRQVKNRCDLPQCACIKNKSVYELSSRLTATFDHDDFLHHIFSSAPWPLSILDDGPSPASDARNQITTVPLPHHNPNDVDGSIQALYNGFSAGSLPFHLPQA
ncbi:hypothetical protein Bca101_007807 [Brassica carinata]